MTESEMTQVVLEASGLVRRYRRGGRDVTPVDGLDLTLRGGEMIAVVGPSGVGKSTLARLLTVLERPDAGSLRLRTAPEAEPVDPWTVPAAELAGLRRRCQLLPQDPVRAVSPRWTVEQVVCEPLALSDRHAARTESHPGLDAVQQRAAELLARVGLDVSLRRRARDLSGGQLQRLVLARALACEPRLLVLDETLTGLDLRRQVAILELLRRLGTDSRLAIVLVSHDVARMAEACDRVWRLQAGRLLPLDGGDREGAREGAGEEGDES